MAELEIKSRLLTCSLVLSSGTLVRPAEMQKVKQAREKWASINPQGSGRL